MSTDKIREVIAEMRGYSVSKRWAWANRLEAALAEEPQRNGEYQRGLRAGFELAQEYAHPGVYTDYWTGEDSPGIDWSRAEGALKEALSAQGAGDDRYHTATAFRERLQAAQARVAELEAENARLRAEVEASWLVCEDLRAALEGKGEE